MVSCINLLSPLSSPLILTLCFISFHFVSFFLPLFFVFFDQRKAQLGLKMIIKHDLRNKEKDLRKQIHKQKKMYAPSFPHPSPRLSFPSYSPLISPLILPSHPPISLYSCYDPNINISTTILLPEDESGITTTADEPDSYLLPSPPLSLLLFSSFPSCAILLIVFFSLYLFC